MENIIEIFIYGNKSNQLGGCCKTSKSDGCGSCSGDCGSKHCGEKENKNVGELFLDLEKFIFKSDVKDKVQLFFVELENNKLAGYSDIEDILERGFEAPITVIDGIVRYYGGISEQLIYKDVIDLLQ